MSRSLVQLVNELAAVDRWLALPNARLWAKQYAEHEAARKVLWSEISRRFPEYVRKQRERAAWRADRGEQVIGGAEVGEAA